MCSLFTYFCTFFIAKSSNKISSIINPFLVHDPNNKNVQEQDGIDSDDERWLDELEKEERGQEIVGKTTTDGLKQEIKQEPEEYQNLDDEIIIKNEGQDLYWSEMKVEIKQEDVKMDEEDPLLFS